MSGNWYDLIAPKGQGSPEQLFASLHGLLKPWHKRLFNGQSYVRFQIRGEAGEVKFAVWIPDEEDAVVKALLRSAYPGIDFFPTNDRTYKFKRFLYVKNPLVPLTAVGESDPLSPTISVLGEQHTALTIGLRPISDRWRGQLHTKARRARSGYTGWVHETFYPDRRATGPRPYALELAKFIDEKTRQVGFNCWITIETNNPRFIRDLGMALRVFQGPTSLGLSKGARAFILTPRELAQLWHVPKDESVYVAHSASIKLPPPRSTTGKVLGISNYPGIETPVAISDRDALRHMHILGPTGTGKSTLLINLALQDIEAGKGVGFIDPKGDVVGKILELIPEHRKQDVILISPDSNVRINPLEWSDREERHLIADNAHAIMKRVFEKYGWGIRTDDLLRAALLTLLERPDATIAEIPDLFLDEKFRAKLIARSDPFVKTYFWDPYEQMGEKQRQDVLAPLLSRLRNILLPEKVRDILCHRRSSFDFQEALDGKILLVSLASGSWGEETASFVGSFLVAKIWQAVRHRIKTPEAERRDFFLYVDEFQNFLGVTQSFSETLAMARSFHLGLTLANQHVAQLPPEIIFSLSSNARSRIVFQCGIDDARYLAKEMYPVPPEAFLALQSYEIIGRVSRDGQTTKPFTARTLPLPKQYPL